MIAKKETFHRVVTGCIFFWFETLEIWAVLDAEPEMNETFIVTLSSPTGGALLGHSLKTFITVLQNQAPRGLFRISPLFNRYIS